ncbi:MAG: DUF4965 domain-containing protein [Thermoguttaceae bacterium]|nr:DUF4965 domain-containing protein [Thermoguttaceae bacterium]
MSQPIARRLTAAALLVAALCALNASSLQAKDPLRAPCVPLVANDPYFSVWSNTDELADSFPVHWTGTINALTSYARVDGKPYRLMGAPNDLEQEVDKLPQTNLAARATNTTYTFEGAGVQLTLRFTNPNLPDDLDVFARPATYVAWTVAATDGKEHDVDVYFDASGELCVNTPDQEIVYKAYNTDALDVMSFASKEQPILEKKGDNLRIDWGRFFIAFEKGAAENVVATHHAARNTFINDGNLPERNVSFPRKANDNWPVMAVKFACGKVGADAVEKRLILAYDDEFSLVYLGEKLRPYWRRNGMEALSMLDLANAQYDELVERCAQFDAELWKRASDAAGEKYASLCSIAYPQAIAAHKLVELANGKLLLVSKENFSNGCAATVDILYPTSPVFIVYSSELLKATMTPALEYAASGRWKFPFSCHDLGTYPILNGQVYGGGETSEENQMPVEETANMLILLDVVARIEGNADYANEYWSILERWAEYLLDKGLDPENQLCTDDFAGHLAHNANLSIKAIVALAAYADLCQINGKEESAKRFREKAEEYAKEWVVLADAGDRFKLAFDRDDTWSQKYNIVWDGLLNLNLFPAEVVEKELAYYQTKMNPYGLPLDNRSDYTKLDWEVWTASLAKDREGFDSIMDNVYEFVNNTPDRVPLSDWYFTSTAKQRGFQARAVVGGVFIKMIDKEALNKAAAE